MADPLLITALGWAAGLINLTSSVPQLLSNTRDPSLAASQNPWRNALQAMGNVLWLYYGVLIGAHEMIVFATLGCCMALGLLLQVLRARRLDR